MPRASPRVLPPPKPDSSIAPHRLPWLTVPLSSSAPKLTYMPALDGLRAVAVVAVLLFHGGVLDGGYLGVDAFFVLSGFLITSLLLVEQQQSGRIDLRRFYARRARRLLPAAWATLIAVAVYGAFVAVPTELARLRADGLATLFYVANWQAVLAEQSYWDLFGAPSPLAHAWSLAIEEQFYLTWPWIVGAVLKRTSRARLGMLCAAGALLSWLWLAMLFEPGDTARAYYGTDTRAGALLLGSGLACLHRSTRSKLAPGVWVALPLLAVAWWGLAGKAPLLYRGGLVATQLAVVALLAAGEGKGPVARALGWRPLRYLGQISYGIYLWHWPLYVVLSPARTGLDGLVLLALRVAASLALAALSYHALEQPIRRGAISRRLGLVLLVAGPLVVAAGLWVATLPRATDASTIDRTWADNRRDATPYSLLLVGDSVAQRLGLAMTNAAPELAIEVTVDGRAGCGLVEPRPHRLKDGTLRTVAAGCPSVAERMQGLARDHRPDKTLLLVGAPTAGTFELDGTFVNGCDSAFDAHYQSQATTALSALAANGAQVYLATMPPPRGDEYGPEEDRRAACLNAALRAAAETTGATIVPLAELVCPEGQCRSHLDGALLRSDGLHFDGIGADRIGFWLVEQMAAP